ncbi:MAG TPA: hypothetical protein VIL37_19160 [Natronosporangium sp.]
MYAWIWRHLPFGLWGKLSGSLLLIGGTAALLWFVVFPWLDPWLEEVLLPFDDSQIDTPGADIVDPANPVGDPAVDPDGDPAVEPTPPIDPHDIPYDTGE